MDYITIKEVSENNCGDRWIESAEQVPERITYDNRLKRKKICAAKVTISTPSRLFDFYVI